jgi:hypothetical protein
LGEDLTLFPLEFNKSIRVEARPERLTSESGAMMVREVIERLGVTDRLVENLQDTRNQDLITHPLRELLNTMLLLFCLGWRDQDDADALRHDPALRLAASQRRGISPLERRPEPNDGQPLSRNPEVPDGLASQPTMSRLYEMLSPPEQRAVLRDEALAMTARRIHSDHRGHRMRYVTLDIDGLPIPVAGHQPGSEYNGYCHARIYYPLIASIGETGDLIDAQLRKGAAHGAEAAEEFILPLLNRVEAQLCQVAAVRIDAAFPEGKLLSALEQRDTPYVARVKNNPVLDRLAQPYLSRPPGRPPTEPRMWFHELAYQAESWSCARRVVLVVQEKPGELFLHYFWLITNWTAEQMSPEALLEHYRQRGTAEAFMGELKNVFDPALSSSPRPKTHYRDHLIDSVGSLRDSFAINEVILLLNMLAYNVAHVARLVTETATGQGWSLRRLRERVLRVAGRILVHGRRATLVISDLSAALWRAVWLQLGRFRLTEA